MTAAIAETAAGLLLFAGFLAALVLIFADLDDQPYEDEDLREDGDGLFPEPPRRTQEGGELL